MVYILYFSKSFKDRFQNCHVISNHAAMSVQAECRNEPVLYAIRITVHIHLYGIIVVVKCLEAEFARTFHVDLNSFLAFGDYFYKPASFFYPFWIIYFG